MASWLLSALVVVFVAGIAIYFLRSAFRQRASKARSRPTGPLGPLADVDSTPGAPVGFGYKTSWLAVRSPTAEAVWDALSIDYSQPANWKSGVVAAYKDRTFVSPVFEGWVFVVGHLPELTAGDANLRWAKWMESLAARFSDVQYFATHRVVEYHAWARFLEGREQRAFAYLGESDETLVNRGQPTEGELQLGQTFFDGSSPEAESDEYWERDDLSYPDEQYVMQIAEKWSINPQTLEERTQPTEPGWIGVLRHSPP